MKDKTRGPRTSIGLFVDFLYNQYQIQIYEGIIQAVRDFGLNLLTFCGGTLKCPYESSVYRNYIFDLANPGIIDGLLVINGVLANFITDAEMIDFLNKFNKIPIVCIGPPLGDFPGIQINNFQGMYDLTSHLIKIHKCKKIGFISGNIQNNIDAQQRFLGYKQALADNNLTFRQDFLYPGDFYENIGKRAAHYYIENPAFNLDAVIASNDIMAYDAMIEFQANNVKIPEDLILAGFDNTEQTQFLNPALTTVAQPLFDIGYRGVKKIITLLQKRETTATEKLDLNLVIRRSCGCKNPYLLNTEKQNKAVDFSSALVNTADFQDLLMKSLKQEIRDYFPEIRKTEIVRKWAYRLAAALVKEFKKDKNADFYLEIEKIIFESKEYVRNILNWQNILKNIFLSLQTSLFKDSYNDVFERLKSYTGELILELNYSIINKKNRILYNEFRLIDLLSQNFISSSSLQAFCDKIKDRLPPLGLRSFFLINLPEQKTDKAKMLTYFDSKNQVRLDDAVFNPQDLLPGGIRKHLEKFNFIVLPINFEKEKLGYVLFEYADSFNEFLYEILANQISTALKSIQLIQYEKACSQNLETEVLKRTADLQNSLKEKDVLLMEIHHRVKNNLQIISSLLNLQTNYTKDTETTSILKTAKNRIKSMAIIYEKLYKSADLANINLKEYLKALVSSLLAAFNKQGRIKTNIKMDDILLSVDKAIPCGLVINELVTNAIKHAFNSQAGNSGKGKNQIYIAINNDNKHCRITVKDNGRGLPEDFNIYKTKTLGFELVNLLVEGQLAGKTEINGKNGTTVKISFKY